MDGGGYSLRLQNGITPESTDVIRLQCGHPQLFTDNPSRYWECANTPVVKWTLQRFS